MLEFYVIVGVMAGIIAMQEWRIWWERKKTMRREDSLLAAVLARSNQEFIENLEAVKREPADKIKEMELENDLAIRAQELTGQQGIPV